MYKATKKNRSISQLVVGIQTMAVNSSRHLDIVSS